MPDSAFIAAPARRRSAPRLRSRIVTVAEPPPTPVAPVFPYMMQIVKGRGARGQGPAKRLRSRVFPEPGRGNYYVDLRGRYRVFGDAEYRFYRSQSGPPEMGAVASAPIKRSWAGDSFAAWSFRSGTWRGPRTAGYWGTNATLPYSPVGTCGEGTWYFSVSYFNGVIESGFLPVGPRGETYLRIDISSGESIDGPPQPPMDWRIEQSAGGVVRIVGLYFELGTLRAEQWAIGYTTNGVDPAEDTPDLTQDMPSEGPCILDYNLPAQVHGTTVKVRLQTRRLDGATWAYSEGSTILTITADATGPAAPETME